MREFNELIKNFSKIRNYMREFYVYGFKTREGFAQRKSLRSYDNERRRIESYLSEFMSFRQNERGKTIFLMLDSQSIEKNPFYRAFKAKSFTKKDITLHFILLDILQEGERYSVSELVERIHQDYLNFFEYPMNVDASTVRNKLIEYVEQGILGCVKEGRSVQYFRMREDIPIEKLKQAVTYFSEVDPLGVIGSFLLDRPQMDDQEGFSLFSYKHNYMMHALESEIFCELMDCIQKKLIIEIISVRIGKKREIRESVLPLRMMCSTQSGRRYLAAYNLRDRHIFNYRLDNIQSVRRTKEQAKTETLQRELDRLIASSWGVSFGNGKSTEQVEMLLKISSQEEYVLERLQREARHGRIMREGEGLYRYKIQVQDSKEMLPWLRTFIGRICAIDFSNKAVEELFIQDICQMAGMYERCSDDFQ